MLMVLSYFTVKKDAFSRILKFIIAMLQIFYSCLKIDPLFSSERCLSSRPFFFKKTETLYSVKLQNNCQVLKASKQ